MRSSIKCFLVFQFCVLVSTVPADDVKKTDIYKRIKAGIDAIPAINTHDHLMPFEKIGHRDKTDHGEGITLRSIWAGSYFSWIHSLEPWPEDGSFDTWWSKAQHNFANARATSFYRYKAALYFAALGSAGAGRLVGVTPRMSWRSSVIAIDVMPRWSAARWNSKHNRLLSELIPSSLGPPINGGVDPLVLPATPDKLAWPSCYLSIAWLAVQSSLLRADGNGSSAIADLRGLNLRGAPNQGHSRDPHQGPDLPSLIDKVVCSKRAPAMNPWRQNPDPFFSSESYLDDLLRVAASLLSDIQSAEDCLHDVFVDFAGAVDGSMIHSNLKSYLISCVANRARDQLRKKTRQSKCQLEPVRFSPLTRLAGSQ